ncbi:MAG TPA: hypothetical protein VNA25_19215 [Phycisphaerae bacterium]|nr:hypothetical protein [Phycisphaerae bacterium]HUT59980.1 hypothetical protein [Phycisphaerae bacterium]
MGLPLDPRVTASPLADLAAASFTPPDKALKGAELRKAAKDFESVLLHRVLNEMKNTIGESGLLDGAVTSQVQDIFWFYLAQELSDQGGLGLWREIYSTMSRVDGGLERAESSTLEQVR